MFQSINTINLLRSSVKFTRIGGVLDVAPE